MFASFEDKGKIFTQVVSKTPIPVLIQVTEYRVRGNLHIRHEERLTDALNQKDPFLAITDAVIEDMMGNVLYETNFLNLNTAFVIWILPESELTKKQVQNDE